MICHRVELVEEARMHLEKLSDPTIHDALERIQAAKAKMGAPLDFTMEGYRKVDDEIWDLRVDTLGEEQAKILSVEDGKRSPVETY
jgi:beta-N-acetylhexosaminidase